MSYSVKFRQNPKAKDKINFMDYIEDINEVCKGINKNLVLIDTKKDEIEISVDGNTQSNWKQMFGKHLFNKLINERGLEKTIAYQTKEYNLFLRSTEIGDSIGELDVLVDLEWC